MAAIEALSQADTQLLEKTHAYISQQKEQAAVAAARKAHALVDEIAAYIQPGMLESEARQFAEKCFARTGIERTWHPVYIRFGEHTLLTFRDKASHDFCLGENDIAFIDIGIVENGIEGDAGRTLVFGDDADLLHLRDVSQTIYDDAALYWQRESPTGIQLYEYIKAQAEKHNVLWNLDPAGHLIGAFPHRGWKRGLNHFPLAVEGGKWILEIQIRHKTLPYGAFYEDLLWNKP